VVDRRDEVLETLEDLTACLEETVTRCTAAIDRARDLRSKRREGMNYQDILSVDDRPLLVELMSATLADLQQSGHKFRSAEARALYDEGMTMTRIAELFGVSHQRISALLRASGKG
jgi:hypothetical protein